MQTIQQEIVIHASKEAVWNVLFNKFTGSDVWNPTVQRSRHSNGTQGEVGCERECDISSKASIHERISAATPNDSFDFDVIGVPMVDEMKNSYELQSIDGGRTEVVFISRLSSKPSFMTGIMRAVMNRMFTKITVAMKYHIETGETVSKSNIKGIMRTYKSMEPTACFTHAGSVG